MDIKDRIQEQIVDYSCNLRFEDLPDAVLQSAKLHVVDTFGSLLFGFNGEPCVIARQLAKKWPFPNGVSVVGTTFKTTPDMAAFVNGTTSRYAEIAGRYDMPGSFGAHTSDTVFPILAMAEYVGASGREFIEAIVLAYEICSRISHCFKNEAFDNTNLSCLSIAVGAGKVMKLSREEMKQCISMALIPGVILKQAKHGQKTMFKAVVTGEAARSAIFAAMLAREGMRGPTLPFEGTAGWCDHVAGGRFSLDQMGGKDVPYSILDTRIKNRPAAGPAIAPILAAEKVGPLPIQDVSDVIVEVHKMTKEKTAPGGAPWELASREDADHSTPYLVAIALRDGKVTLRSFEESNVFDSSVRALMQKIKVVEDKKFTEAYERLPQQNWARVLVSMNNGQNLTGISGGDEDDLATPKSAAQVENKFRTLCEGILSEKRLSVILKRLWDLEDIGNTADISPLCVIQ